MTKYNHKIDLNNFGLRATPARIAIMQLLESTKEPVDIATITNHLVKEDISTNPATVFRIMNMFTQKGITLSIHLQEGKTRYELGSKDHHHHLICENCGRIEDVEDTVLPAFEKHIAEKHNFIVKRHALEFFGLCSSC